VLDAIDFDHHAGPIRQKQKKIHLLAF